MPEGEGGPKPSEQMIRGLDGPQITHEENHNRILAQKKSRRQVIAGALTAAAAVAGISLGIEGDPKLTPKPKSETQLPPVS